MLRVLSFTLGLLGSGVAFAHGFGTAYNLPVPLALYNWAAGTTLIVSFLMIGLLWSKASGVAAREGVDISASLLARGMRRLLPWLRAISVFLLLLCIATGFLGARDPVRNFGPIFFWVVFLLAFSYAVLLVGDVYAVLNPFQSLSGLLARLFPGFDKGRWAYPARLADWPALGFYLAFIWFELFSHRTPHSLATFLLLYTLLNLGGVYLVGRKSWFAHCEFLSVFFRLLGCFAPLEYIKHADGRRGLRLRMPLSALINGSPGHVSTLVFVLAMISTTAMDGLQATQWWAGLFWSDPTGMISQWVGGEPVLHMRSLMPFYLGWQSFWLFFLPFVYLGLYLFAVAIARLLTGSSRPVMQLALEFGYTLLPIAVVYNITHYWTLISAHGLKIFSLISDPFGWRWDLFGTAMKFRAPILPDMGVVWHSQVGLILLGHILSVGLAHAVAIRLWPHRGQAMLSQLPMLALMVAFTVFGLWVLSQPLTAIRPT